MSGGQGLECVGEHEERLAKWNNAVQENNYA